MSDEERYIPEKNIKGQTSSMPIMTLLKLVKNRICKIKCSIGTGTGFFCIIKLDEWDNMRILITNRHVLTENDIKPGKKISFSTNNDENNYEIEINKERKTYINKRYDVTIVEMKKEDKLNSDSFFEIDDNVFDPSYNFKGKLIYLLHYEKGKEMFFSQGNIQEVGEDEDNFEINHTCSSDHGSSGGPLINTDNYKVIAIHKGASKKENYNLGSLLNKPITEFKNKIKNNDDTDNNQNQNENKNDNATDAVSNSILDVESKEDIEFRNPIFNLENHKDNVLSLTVLKDKRLASGARDSLIIIYNKASFKPEITIKEHTYVVCCLCQLSSGPLASCSLDKKIKLFNIKETSYEVLQILDDHYNGVLKIIELTNKQLVSCSLDNSIIFYNKNDSKYQKDQSYPTRDCCYSMVQTKENEICYSEKEGDTICFFDFSKKKIVSSISNINKHNHTDEWPFMLNEVLLVFPGQNKLTIVDVNQYKVVRIVDADGANWIMGNCLINKDILITGDNSKTLRQWKIEDDNLILISKKENVHPGDINTLVSLNNGHFASGSDYGNIKIW